MRYLVFILLLAISVMLVLPPLPALAIAQPDSPPQVNAVYVFDGLLEEGDTGVLIDYYLDYAVLPTETATEAYLAVFYDTVSTTQFKSVAPYTYVDSGYHRGMVWIYFTAAEVTTLGVDSANIADYEIWLVGNPTLTWGGAGDPPKTVAGIDQWNTTGDMAVLLALRVLFYADVLELAWSLDMIESTALGNRLTSAGESYFLNVIADLRTMAPACFATGVYIPTLEDIGYTTLTAVVDYIAWMFLGSGAVGDAYLGDGLGGIIILGAEPFYYLGIATTGTAAVTGSPVLLVAGANTITVGGVPGTFTIELLSGVYGTLVNGTGTVTTSPSSLAPGVQTITATGAGTLVITIAISSTQQTLIDEITGTGFDLTTIAAIFGMSRLMFSSLLWFVLTIILCAAPYGWSRREGSGLGGTAVGGSTMLLFALSLIGGALLGLLDLRVIAMLAIGYGAFIGYVLFFRTSADIGRAVMFMGWMWFVVCLVGGILVGITPQGSTHLVDDITATDDVIPVFSTEGFREQGILVIGDERILFHNKSDTEFTGTAWRVLVRGTQDTDAEAHSANDVVRPLEGSLLNDSLAYNVALLSDASGLLSFVTIPLVIWDIVTSFIFLPLAYLGTNMVILTYVWGIIGLGTLVSLFIALVGGRRMS